MGVQTLHLTIHLITFRSCFVLVWVTLAPETIPGTLSLMKALFLCHIYIKFHIYEMIFMTYPSLLSSCVQSAGLAL